MYRSRHCRCLWRCKVRRQAATRPMRPMRPMHQAPAVVARQTLTTAVHRRAYRDAQDWHQQTSSFRRRWSLTRCERHCRDDSDLVARYLDLCWPVHYVYVRYNMVYSRLYECNEYNAYSIMTLLFHDHHKLGQQPIQLLSSHLTVQNCTIHKAVLNIYVATLEVRGESWLYTLALWRDSTLVRICRPSYTQQRLQSQMFFVGLGLNPFSPAFSWLYSKMSLPNRSGPYWSNPPFLIFDIRALWRSVLSARAPECQKLKKWWVRPVWPWTLWGMTIRHHWALKS